MFSNTVHARVVHSIQDAWACAYFETPQRHGGDAVDDMEHRQHEDEDVQLVDAGRGDEGHLALHAGNKQRSSVTHPSSPSHRGTRGAA